MRANLPENNACAVTEQALSVIRLRKAKTSDFSQFRGPEHPAVWQDALMSTHELTMLQTDSHRSGSAQPSDFAPLSLEQRTHVDTAVLPITLAGGLRSCASGLRMGMDQSDRYGSIADWLGLLTQSVKSALARKGVRLVATAGLHEGYTTSKSKKPNRLRLG